MNVVIAEKLIHPNTGQEMFLMDIVHNPYGKGTQTYYLQFGVSEHDRSFFAVVHGANAVVVIFQADLIDEIPF